MTPYLGLLSPTTYIGQLTECPLTKTLLAFSSRYILTISDSKCLGTAYLLYDSGSSWQTMGARVAYPKLEAGAADGPAVLTFK